MMDVVGVERVEAAYRRVHGRLWRALLAYARDAEVASDSEAEAFSQVLRRGEAVDDVDAWVWRAAFRIATGMLADRQRPGRQPTEVVSVPMASSTAEFLGLLAGLSAQQRACVTLRHAGGFTPTEIAGILDTTPGTVRVQLHRAHASLRTTLSSEDRCHD